MGKAAATSPERSGGGTPQWPGSFQWKQPDRSISARDLSSSTTPFPLHYFVVSALSNTSKFGVFLQPMKPRFAARRTAILAMCLGSILSNIASNVDVTYLSKSIIHVLTMEALGVRHLPYCHESVIYSEEKAQKVKEEEEWDEILDEDRALIEKLDELTGEFEQEFFNQNLPIGEFLRLHWHPRIRQVQRELRSLVESQRQQLRQLGVVLDDKCEQFPDYDLDDNYALDYDQDWDPDAWQDVNHCGDAYFDEDYGDEDSEDEYYEDEYSEPEDSEHKDSEDEDSANEGTEIERE
ncbi:hypothetical protein CEP54_010866 [Fusarium duplospermum]|uniref:Uncharacterized protein n=1 Tax=Fusarium duplospermum TaxID=1325734 RepID=A0A428PHL5_9HYPO|nr:hypothetical protein CEP54_010866 [Fusarium duplospermum]